jgi:hypothetical protein
MQSTNFEEQSTNFDTENTLDMNQATKHLHLTKQIFQF